MTDGSYRLGLLVPSSNTVMEPDPARRLAPDVTAHTARMLLRDVTAEDEERMLDEHTLPAAETLATLEPHLTVFGCTSAPSRHCEPRPGRQPRDRRYDDA